LSRQSNNVIYYPFSLVNPSYPNFPINNDLILKNYIKKPIHVIYYSTTNGIELMQRCSMLIANIMAPLYRPTPISFFHRDRHVLYIEKFYGS